MYSRQAGRLDDGLGAVPALDVPRGGTTERLKDGIVNLRNNRHGVVLVLATVALGGSGASRAAPTPTSLQSGSQVAAVVYSAARSVTVTAPSIRSREVADALRRAAVERGANVFILADDRYVREPAGFLSALSLVPGIQVRLVRGVSQSWVIVDGKVALAGPLVWEVASPLESRATVVDRGQATLARLSGWFSRSWKVARVYRYTLRVPMSSPR